MIAKHINNEDFQDENQKNLKSIDDLLTEIKHMKDLLSFCAHDFREPLRTINGLMQLLAKEIDNTLSKEAELYFSMITQCINRLYIFSEDLLLQDAATQDTTQIVSISAVLKDVSELLWFRMQTVKAKIDIPSHIPSIRGSYIQIQHIFMNILDNAFKHGAKDDLHINVEFQITADTVVFTISNNVNYLSIPNLSFHGFTRHSYRFGLELCKYLIQKNGGEFSTSQKNKDDIYSVIFSLPLA